jgi:hypothetical protein
MHARSVWPVSLPFFSVAGSAGPHCPAVLAGVVGDGVGDGEGDAVGVGDAVAVAVAVADAVGADDWTGVADDGAGVAEEPVVAPADEDGPGVCPGEAAARPPGRVVLPALGPVVAGWTVPDAPPGTPGEWLTAGAWPAAPPA